MSCVPARRRRRRRPGRARGSSTSPGAPRRNHVELHLYAGRRLTAPTPRGGVVVDAGVAGLHPPAAQAVAATLPLGVDQAQRGRPPPQSVRIVAGRRNRARRAQAVRAPGRRSSSAHWVVARERRPDRERSGSVRIRDGRRVTAGRRGRLVDLALARPASAVPRQVGGSARTQPSAPRATGEHARHPRADPDPDVVGRGRPALRRGRGSASRRRRHRPARPRPRPHG